MNSAKESFIQRLYKSVQNEDVQELSHLLSSTYKDLRQFTKIELAKVLNSLNYPYKEIIEIKDSKTSNLLHLAASKLNNELMQILMENGANSNVRDGEGRTGVLLILERIQECLCQLCTRKAVRCINTLGDFHADFSIQNKSGNVPLFIAAQLQSLEIATALLRNGAPLDIPIGTQNKCGQASMLSVFSEKLPSIVLDVFDRAVTIVGSKGINEPDFEIVFDLSVILPSKITEFYQQSNKGKPTKVERPNNLRQSSAGNNQIHPKNSKTDESSKSIEKNRIPITAKSSSRKDSQINPDNEEEYRPRREMGYLNDLLESNHLDSKIQRKILRHPLVKVFTDIKWRSLEIIFIIFIFMQIGVLIAYTIFLFIVIFVDCPYELYREVLRGNFAHLGTADINLKIISDKLPTPEKLCEIQLASKVISLGVLMCTLTVLIKELNHAFMDFKAYATDLLNYVQLGGLSSIILTIVIAWDPGSRFYSWLYPVASFGICISWCQLFVQIGRFPKLAIYIDMFAKIAMNFCWSLLIYSFILVGFAMSYCILFPTKPKVIDIPLALVRVLTMMTGELDYDSLFKIQDEENDNDAVKVFDNSTSSFPRQWNEMKNYHPIAGHVWYVCLVIMVTLVLMNLLVGLAVSDIQGCRKDAEVFVMKRRIRYTVYLEKSYFLLTHFLPRFLKDFLRRKIVIIKPTSEKTYYCFRFHSVPVEDCKLNIKPNDPKDRILSEQSKSSIKYWLMDRKTTRMKQTCRFQQQSFGYNSDVNHGLNGNDSSCENIEPVGPLVKDDKNRDSSQDPVERSLGSPPPSIKSQSEHLNIKRIDKKLSELDHKLDLLIESLTHSRRSKSPQ